MHDDREYHSDRCNIADMEETERKTNRAGTAIGLLLTGTFVPSYMKSDNIL
ncbi:MAG: hypothetical protein IKS51_08430 [Erysipelotrichaceae bacterium]|nr:hypothetical protein [Erysipelotrichaceae bacterium]